MKFLLRAVWFCAVLLFSISNVQGQVPSNFWFFGWGTAGTNIPGIDFTGGAPVQLNGVANMPGGFYESLTIQSSPTAVLFYSNSHVVMDATHTIMPGVAALPGGELTGALGVAKASATQGVVSFPYPGSTTRYAMVSTAAVDGPSHPLYYTDIDMTLPGNGTPGSPLGDLGANVEVDISGGVNTTEMIGVYAQDCDNIWVVSHEHGSDRFVSVLFTTAGPQAPVYSNAGAAYTGDGGRGTLRISPDGTQIIVVGGFSGHIQIFSFDATTGVVGNPAPGVNGGSPTLWPLDGFNFGYGAEWGPNSRYVYVGGYTTIAGIKVYDTQTGTASAITGAGTYGDLQMGPDGVIYCAPQTPGGPNLATITNPELGPGSTFNAAGWPMGAGGGYLGLPATFSCPTPTCSVGAASSSPTVCEGEAITDITHATTGVTGVTSSTGLPPGVTANYAANTLTISGTPTTAGVYNYTIDLASCGDDATGTITVNAAPTITTSNGDSRCGTGTLDLTATASAGTLNWYAAATGGASLGTGSPFTTPSISSTTTYYVDATNNGCTTPARTAVVATVNTVPSGHTANDDSRCGTGTVNLSVGNVPAGAEVDWYDAATGGTLLQANSTSYTTPSIASTTIYYAELRDAVTGCTSAARIPVTATINPDPTVSLTLVDDNACDGEAAFALSGGTPVPGGVPETGVYSGNGVTVSPNFDPAVAGIGVHTITYTYTDANGCPGTATDDLEVFALPVVGLVLDPNAACLGAPDVTLTGGTPAANPPTTTGVYSGPGITSSPTLDPSAAGVGVHLITYTYTDANGCSADATGNFEVYPDPVVALTLVDDDACEGEPVLALDGGTPVPAGPPAAGTYSGNGVTTSPNFDPATAGVGVHTITYTYFDNNGCTGTATDDFTVNAAPTGITANDGDRCGPGTVNLSVGNVPAGTEVDWYDAATGGTLIQANSTTYTTPSIASTTIYYAELRNVATGCLSTARVAVTATINDAPTGATADDGERCGPGTVNLSVSNVPVGVEVDWYDALTGGAQIAMNSVSYTTPSISSTTTYYAELRNPTSGCLSLARVPVTATINDLPSGITANDDSRCGTGTVNLSVGNVPAGAEVDWYDAATGGALLQANSGTYTTPSISSTTIYYAELRNPTTGCLSATRVPVTATINDLPTGITAGDGSNCGPGTVNLSVSNLPAGVEADWYDASTGGTLLQGNSTSYTTPSIASTTVYYVELRNTVTGCLSDTRVAVTATINDLPTGATANDDTRCGTGTVNLSLSNVPAGVEVDWYDALTGGTLLQGGVAVYVTPSISTTTIYYAELRDATTGCIAAARIPVTATVNDLPAVSVNSGMICPGDPAITFTATAPTAIEYLWSDLGMGTGSTTTGAIEGNYTVTVRDALGCENSATGVLTFTIPPSVTVNDAAICDGDPAATFTADAPTAISFVWSDNGSGTGNSTSGTTPGLYTVTVDDGTCTNTASGNLIVNALPVPDLGPTLNVCEGVPVTVYAGTYVNYTWQDGSTADSYTVDNSDTLRVVVEDINGCFGEDSVYSVLRDRPVLVELRDDTTICEEANDVVSITVQNLNVGIVWQDSSDVQVYEAMTAGTYTVVIFDEYGCRDTGEVVLTAGCSTIDLTMPNVFTPDGTGINDYFIPIEMEWADKDFMFNNVKYLRFHVFNRWGVMVHASEGILPRWDGFAPNGEQCSDGTYFWSLQYQDHANEPQNFNGFVRLLRKRVASGQ